MSLSFHEICKINNCNQIDLNLTISSWKYMKKFLPIFIISLFFFNYPVFSQDPSEKFKQLGGDITESIKKEGDIYHCVGGYVLAIHQNKISFAERWSLRVEKRDKIPEKFDQLNPESTVITEVCYEEQKPLYWWSNEFKKIDKLFTASTSCGESIAFIENDPNNKSRATLFHKGSQKNDVTSRTSCFPVKKCGPIPPGPGSLTVGYTNQNVSSFCHKR